MTFDVSHRSRLSNKSHTENCSSPLRGWPTRFARPNFSFLLSIPFCCSLCHIKRKRAVLKCLKNAESLRGPLASLGQLSASFCLSLFLFVVLCVRSKGSGRFCSVYRTLNSQLAASRLAHSLRSANFQLPFVYLCSFLLFFVSHKKEAGVFVVFTER